MPETRAQGPADGVVNPFGEAAWQGERARDPLRDFLVVYDQGARRPEGEAAPRVPRRPEARAQRCLLFRLGEQTYGISIQDIREIIRMQRPTRVPRAPAFLAGVISLRGAIVPVLDLRLRLGLPAAPFGHPARILVVAREPHLYGLAVEAVEAVVDIDPAQVEAPPPGLAQDHVRGVGRVDGRMLVMLELDAILAFEAKG
jgi:purine-binding chemotaxis protein CheW